MANQTIQEYYNDVHNLGSHQWFSFNEIIDELEIIATDNDSYIHNTRRSQFINATKQGVKVLQKQVKKEVKAIEFIVPQSLTFPYPQDYLNWISLNLIHENKLHPIFINKSINTATRLIQDEETFVFDTQGRVIMIANPTPTNDSKCYKVENKYPNPIQTQGQAVFNDLQGRISFGSDMQGKSIVLEYYSDGLFTWTLTDQEIKERNLKPVRIHKELKEVLIKFVYQEIIAYRRNVPANEKQRAKQEYKTYLHQAKLDRLGLNLYTVSKMLR